MPYKDPTNWPWGVWVLAVGMSLTGGFINWYSRVKSGHLTEFKLIEIIGELFTSGAVGLGVFMLLDAMDQPIGACAFAGAVAGHMGINLLTAFGRIVESRANALIVKIQDKENGCK